MWAVSYTFPTYCSYLPSISAGNKLYSWSERHNLPRVVTDSEMASSQTRDVGGPESNVLTITPPSHTSSNGGMKMFYPKTQRHWQKYSTKHHRHTKSRTASAVWFPVSLSVSLSIPHSAAASISRTSSPTELSPTAGYCAVPPNGCSATCKDFHHRTTCHDITKLIPYSMQCYALHCV